ncbi:MAG: type II toxin-antitoxin system RelB/DinJ family antitoxin [Candidatus Pacebacteria bacterium]|nr:type II toxin-antitoxin system RelB/DinJ family antitoxin [Candidatus Paceibacterota bacterium]
MITTTKAVINIKTDKEVKRKAQIIAKDLGLSLSSIINANLRQLIKNKSVHFSTKPTYRVRPEVEKELLQAVEDYKNGVNISPVFSSVKEMDKYLNAL